MKRFVSALVAVTAMWAPTDVAAQDSEWNRYTLENLGGVYVRADADAACEGAGLDASKVSADAAIQLLETDVGLLTRAEMLENPGLPELRITVQCTTDGGDAGATLAYSVSVRVQQAAQMIRDNQVTLPEAVTWYATTVGLTAASGARIALEGAITGRLEHFVEAYVAANTDDTGN